MLPRAPFLLHAKLTTLVMKNLLAVGSVLVLMSACETIPAEEVANATLYFPPRVKYLQEPRSPFTGAERQKALKEYKKDGANTLFEFIIDPEGKVKKVHLLRTHVKDVYHEEVLSHARFMEFTPDPSTKLYRAFYCPMKYDLKLEFEWL